MTDIPTLAAAIAPLIGGTVVTTGDEIDQAPADKDIAWIGLAAPNDGLRVVLRRGHGAERTRVRAVMYQTHANRDGADFRETPAFHELETAAAVSRGAEVIARQIKAKIITPAIPMLEEWNRKRAAQKESIRQHEKAGCAMTDTSVMPVACPTVRTEWDMALNAVAAGNAATLDIAEAMRGDMPIAENLRHRETAENLADALRAVLALLHGSPPPIELQDQHGRYDDGNRLLVAVQDYLDGWEA